METQKRGKGRPRKYLTNDEKSYCRRLQNRINQRRFKEKKKLQKKLIDISKKDFNLEYQTEIFNFFNRFNYDFYFTGTFNTNKVDKDYLKKTNELLKLGHEFDQWLSQPTNEEYSSIHSVKGYVDRYINFLFSKNVVNRCFYVVEKGKKNNYHVHILFKSQPDIINFDNYSEESWLIGKSMCLPVIDQENQENILKYILKELKPTSSLKSDQFLVDYWSFREEFEQMKSQKRKIIKSPVDFNFLSMDVSLLTS